MSLPEYRISINVATGAVVDLITGETFDSYKQWFYYRDRLALQAHKELAELRDLTSDLQNLPGEKVGDPIFEDDWHDIIPAIERPDGLYPSDIIQ